MLQIDKVSSGYGMVEVLHGVSLDVRVGEIVSLIGANGAGKSTLLRTISGLIPCKSGKIVFDGQETTRMGPHKIVSQGLIQMPEGGQVFTPLTTYENLVLGYYSKYSPLHKTERERLIEYVYGIFPILAKRKRQKAGTLSGGEQQMLAFGRALMAQPKLLLLDEPTLGLAPTVVDSILELLKVLNTEQGLAILLVEQNALIALMLASRGYVLDGGRVALQGKAHELLHNDKVREVYLGEMPALSSISRKS